MTIGKPAPPLLRCADCEQIEWVRRRQGHDYQSWTWSEFFSPSTTYQHLNQPSTGRVPFCEFYKNELDWVKAAINIHPQVLVGYLAHPVRADTDREYYLNLDNALDWLRFLSDPDNQRIVGMKGRWEIICPWFADAMSRPGRLGIDGALRTRHLGRCMVVAARCDGVILCGGGSTTGMQLEAKTARLVVDLTHLGYTPPWSEADANHQEEEVTETDDPDVAHRS